MFMFVPDELLNLLVQLQHGAFQAAFLVDAAGRWKPQVAVPFVPNKKGMYSNEHVPNN